MNNVIDPQAGTHFTGKIFVVPHALDRTVEHFGVERGLAPMWVMDRLRKAALIDANAVAEDGKSFRLFAYRRIAFAVAQNEDTVITLYPQENADTSVVDGVQKVLARVLKAAQRKETRETKRLNICKAELTVERAECELRRLKTGSVNVVAAMDERIRDIDVELAHIRAEVYEVKREKTSLAKGICAYI